MLDNRKEPTLNTIPFPREGEKRKVFAVSYGRISKIAVRVEQDRVKRTLFLYDPRSNDENGFVMVVLPHGRLPDVAEANGDIVKTLSEWAKKDVDQYLDGADLLYALPGQENDGKTPRVRERKQSSSSQEEVKSEARAEDTTVPQSPPETAAPAADNSGTEQRSTPEPKEEESSAGLLRFAGMRPHSYNGREYTCFTVDIVTSTGVTDTFRGAHLEDRIRELGIQAGDHVKVAKVGKKGRKNLFRVTKLG